MIGLLILFTAVVVLAYANGANDNFKPVATLFGSGTTDFWRAAAWSTAATFAGSLLAIAFAGELLAAFTSRGLVAEPLTRDLNYVAAVAAGAAFAVLLATRCGLPVSTTHSLVGAMIGAAWSAGSAMDYRQLGSHFVLPLLLSPAVALGSVCVLYPAFRCCRLRFGVNEATCLCVGGRVVEIAPAGAGAVALDRAERLSVVVGDTVTCQRRYQGRLLGIEAATVLDRLHFLSAGVVALARGLNDTPKIAALLLLAPAIGGTGGPILVGCAIAAGGLLSVRRVATTMSHRITGMNHGQGFTANLATGLVVIGASRLGLPVSTTHVSCGALFGIGALTGTGRLRMIVTIVAAWVSTLPLAAVLAGVCYQVLVAVR